MTLCEDRACIVTGAGRGIGREYALLLARLGAKVVVNDLGGAPDGAGSSVGPAHEVVDQIRAGGGTAVVNTDDVSDWQGARRLIDAAVDSFGHLDVLVNNAGILRDRMLFNMTEEDWDAVIAVHLKGTFATTRWAAVHWRERAKSGAVNDARIINTTSTSGLYGQPGQANYGTAKMGVAGFTVIASRELGRYGVTVNAIAPAALTRLTEGAAIGRASDDERAQLSANRVAPLCAWLASSRSADVTGRVFEASGRFLAVAEGWHRGPSTESTRDPEAVDSLARTLLATARPNADITGGDPS